MRQLFQKVASLMRGKDPWLEIARLLGVSDEDMKRLGSSSDTMEAFSSLIEHRYGGFIDWRSTPEDIYNVLLPCLSVVEREFLPASPESIETAQALEVLKDIALYFDMAPRVLRILETGSDAYLVLLIPRDSARELESAIWPARYLRLA